MSYAKCGKFAKRHGNEKDKYSNSQLNMDEWIEEVPVKTNKTANDRLKDTPFKRFFAEIKDSKQ